LIEQTTSLSLEAGSEALEPEVVLSEAEQTTCSEGSMARYPKSEVDSIQPLPRGWLGGMSTGGINTLARGGCLKCIWERRVPSIKAGCTFRHTRHMFVRSCGSWHDPELRGSLHLLREQTFDLRDVSETLYILRKEKICSYTKVPMEQASGMEEDHYIHHDNRTGHPAMWQQYACPGSRSAWESGGNKLR